MTDRSKPAVRVAPATRQPMTAEQVRKLEEERRRKAARPGTAEPRHADPVDESSDESFPASDPPAHGGGRR